jgi:hypothetical protein
MRVPFGIAFDDMQITFDDMHIDKRATDSAGVKDMLKYMDSGHIEQMVNTIVFQQFDMASEFSNNMRSQIAAYREYRASLRQMETMNYRIDRPLRETSNKYFLGEYKRYKGPHDKTMLETMRENADG